MVLITDVLDSINDAFPVFSYGERHIDEILERYSFNQDGLTQQWEMFDLLSRNVMEFLRDRFPALGERNRSICCERQMCQLREKIERNERECECYNSIVTRCANL
jgi:hypothetical protein